MKDFALLLICNVLIGGMLIGAGVVQREYQLIWMTACWIIGCWTGFIFRISREDTPHDR
jgi:hypothetical protein